MQIDRAWRIPADTVAVALLLACAVAIWIQAIWTPFWGDDYVYLYGARLANQGGQSWWQTFWPAQPLPFWRPLSQEAWWRIVEGAMASDAFIAHGAALILHLLAAAAVGLAGAALARAAGWPRSGRLGVLAGAIYGVLALNVLPVHWVAAVNSSILVMFTGLILAAWMAAGVAEGRAVRLLLLAVVPVLFVLALLSKESAVLTPVLMVGFTLFARAQWRRGHVATLAACAVIALIWLVLRAQVTTPPAAQYAYAFGINLVRNVVSLVAWLCNVPREALRMLVGGDKLYALGWIAAVTIPLVAAWWLALRGGVARLQPRQWLLVLMFTVVAYAPYFPLSWNSYAYYAAVASMLPVIVLARLLDGRRRVLVASLLLGCSGWLSVAGTRQLDHPALIGRARWAEATFRQLEQRPITPPLWVQVQDAHRFYAMGPYGLAWRLGLPLSEIHIVDACPPRPGTCLVIRRHGR